MLILLLSSSLILTLISTRYNYFRIILVNADFIRRNDLKPVVIEAESLKLGIRPGRLDRFENYFMTILLHMIDLILKIITILIVLRYSLPIQIYVPVPIVLDNFEATNVGSW